MANNGSDSGIVPAVDTTQPTRQKADTALEPIAPDPRWLYQPDDATDISDMRKNPIPFVGIGEDTRLGDIFENHTIQPSYESAVPVNIADLVTLQPFVLQSGIDNYVPFDGSERPYVIEFNGKLYLIDGNHRVARALLDGQTTIIVDISHQKLK